MLMSVLAALLSLPSLQMPSTPQQAAAMPLAFEPADRDAYVLGPGDVLEVIVEGGASPAALASGLFPQSYCTVSSDGELGISGLGHIAVGGLSISEAELEIARLLRSYYPGIRIGISLSSPRLVRVRASGAVSDPGDYSMYALQTVADLLDACGPTATCSRTGWVFTPGDSTRFDLRIDPATHGSRSDPLLEGGSTVLFQTCENPVYIVRQSQQAVVGDPILPMIQAWEVDEPIGLPSFLEMTGGAGADFDPGQSRLSRSGEMLPIWSDSGIAGILVFPGDTLFLARAATTVTVSGAVAGPGVKDWVAGTRALDYVQMAGGILPQASTGGLRLIRNGMVIASGSEASESEPVPGDIVEVPYKWATRNTDMFVILGAIVSTAAIVINLSQ